MLLFILVVIIIFSFLLIVCIKYYRKSRILQLRINETIDDFRNEILQDLTGGIAHNFNNVLMKILSTAELIALKNKKNIDLLLYISQLKGFAMQAARLSDSLTQFSTANKDMDKEEIFLDEIIAEIISSQISNHPDILYNLTLEKQINPILSSKKYISEMINCVIDNAIDASKENSEESIITVTLTNWKIKTSRKTQVFKKNIMPGKYIYIQIKDTGPGISKKINSKIFNPYFSTKALGRGLGLSIANNICKREKGYLFLENWEKGAKASILLPFH